MKKRGGVLSQRLLALIEQHTALTKSYVKMRPGRAKSKATVELARLHNDIKRLRARIAGHGHRKT